MAALEQVVFLLVLQFSCARLEQDARLVFGHAGGDVGLHVPGPAKDGDRHLLYRSSGEGHQLLMNVSALDGSAVSKTALYTTLNNQSVFCLTNLSLSDGGTYKAETWREGRLETTHTFQLTVCHRMRVNLTCPTPSGHRGRVEWQTPGKLLSFDPFLHITSLHTSAQEHMYIGRDDYSLIIPSVSPAHSGRYKCMAEPGSLHQLFVCVILEPVFVMFSQGDNATLVCSNQGHLLSPHWYYQRGTEQELQILNSRYLRFPLQLWDKVDSNEFRAHKYLSLTISNLSAENSGVYRCLLWSEEIGCVSLSFYLVYESAFGVRSPFYRAYVSLMGCGLLLMLSAVTAVSLKAKGRRGSPLAQGTTHPTPKHPESIELQSRDDAGV
ncbi:hypothetical protein ACEWY4_027511 [Coilia grayii]|uniref:Ig-like domain-containing protein n=1 Tax=Coilia grayii TaxID=363190 RepID=A0ABD1IPE2_9TELE